MGQGANTKTDFYVGNIDASLSNTSGELKLLPKLAEAAHSYSWSNGDVSDDMLQGNSGNNTANAYEGADKLHRHGGDDTL